MSKPFDATTKHLVETMPQDWPAYIGMPTEAQVEVIDADLATITADADRVLKINADAPWLLHIEFQSGHERDLAERTLEYNVLLIRRHKMITLSVIILLRPDANTPELTGLVEHIHPSGRRIHVFSYDVVRVWQKPVEEALSGGLATLPLAPLSDVSQDALPGVIARMKERIEVEARSADEAGELWTATYVLMGLRYKKAFTERLLKGVRAMKESVTYQAIVEEGVEKGRVEGLRDALLRLGGRRFGPPDAATQAILDSIASVKELERLTDRILDVESWSELLSQA